MAESKKKEWTPDGIRKKSTEGWFRTDSDKNLEKKRQRLLGVDEILKSPKRPPTVTASQIETVQSWVQSVTGLLPQGEPLRFLETFHQQYCAADREGLAKTINSSPGAVIVGAMVLTVAGLHNESVTKEERVWFELMFAAIKEAIIWKMNQDLIGSEAWKLYSSEWLERSSPGSTPPLGLLSGTIVGMA